MNSEQLFRSNPQDYALGLVSEGILSHKNLCEVLLCHMSCDVVRDALDAGGLSPRFIGDPDESPEIA